MVVCNDATTGLHSDDHSWHISRFLKYELLGQTTTSGLSLVCTRISIALLVLRLTTPKPWFRIGIYVIIALIFASHLPLAIVLFARCKPVRKYWMPDVPGKCLLQMISLAVGYVNCGMLQHRLGSP